MENGQKPQQKKKDIQPVGYAFSALTSSNEIEVDLV